MNDTLPLLLAIAVGGAGVGWAFARHSNLRGRQLAWAVAGLPLAALVLILLASLLGSNTLGWIGGFSLMFMAPLGLPFVIGASIGWAVGRRGRPAPDAVATEVRPVKPLRKRLFGDAQRQSFSAGILLMAASVLAGFWVFIGVGFRLDGRRAPAAVDAGRLPAAAVLLCALAAGARWLWRHRPGFGGPSLRQRIAAHRESRASTAEHKRWLAAMRQDPLRKRYAERIDAGDLYWAWPERVEYDLDVNATASCRHLAPLESAMRGAGIDIKLHGPMTLHAHCLIDETALRLRHPLPSSVRYGEFVHNDRGVEEQLARLVCGDCHSVIWVLHSGTAAARAPQFP